MLRRRTIADNRQLTADEVQFESVQGAVSAHLGDGLVHASRSDHTITTVRGVYGRKAQIAVLDAEALDAFIEYLQQLRRGMEKDWEYVEKPPIAP